MAEFQFVNKHPIHTYSIEKTGKDFTLQLVDGKKIHTTIISQSEASLFQQELYKLAWMANYQKTKPKHCTSYAKIHTKDEKALVCVEDVANRRTAEQYLGELHERLRK